MKSASLLEDRHLQAHFHHCIKMKLSILSASLALFGQLALAAPTPTEDTVIERARIAKRATITDVADTGYATQNGG